MNEVVTNLKKIALGLSGIFLFSTMSIAQETSPLGDDFIFFVEGVNTSVPALPGASVIKDTKNPETRGNVVSISGGAFFQNGFFWEVGGQGGVDFSANIASGDSVFISVRLDSTQINGGKTIGLTIADVTNGTDSDLQFGITWRFPAEFYDNEWHDLVIPLPYATWAKHDSAKLGKNIKGQALPEDSLYSTYQARWSFDPAWSNVSFSEVGPADARFKDVEWNKVGRFAISLNNNQSATVFVDKFWVGSSKTDVSVATSAASPATGLAAAQPTNSNVRLTWAPADETVGSFNLYYSGSAITDITSPEVFLLGNFKTSDDLEFTHTSSVPHPSVTNVDYHYAVVTTNKWGYVPPTAEFATAQISATGTQLPFIFELSEAQETAVQSALISKSLETIGVPTGDFTPFQLQGASTSGAYKGPDDASAKIWASFGRLEGFSTLYLYMEVKDDDVRGGPANNPGEMMGTTIYPSSDEAKTWVAGPNADLNLEWNFYAKDQIIMNLGAYGVDFVTGTTNGVRKRGEKPDYYIAFQPVLRQAGATAPDSMITRMWLTEPSTNPSNAYETVYYNSTQTWTFSPVFEVVKENDVYKGWRALIAIDVQDLIQDETNDATFELPSKSELKYVPLMFTLVDKDGENPDGGNWWEVPTFQYSAPTRPGAGASGLFVTDPSIRALGTVALAGADVVTSNEQIEVEKAFKFELAQNYPNPFNPSTTIKFTLGEAQNVRLTVYNVLGQRVATIVRGEVMNSGTHAVQFDASKLASGVYTYTLEAGAFKTSKRMLLIK